jgi:hypothetical protein
MPDTYKNAASSGFYKDVFSLQPIFLENLLIEPVFD